MKIHGHGQARVLTSSEIERLFTWGLRNNRDRLLFGICLHTGCRISEALALMVDDIIDGYLVLRKQTTKGKKATRTIPINAKLNALLVVYLREESPKEWLFPGHHNAKTRKPLTRAAADLILKEACFRVGLVGVSTHSFGSTARANASNFA